MLPSTSMYQSYDWNIPMFEKHNALLKMAKYRALDAFLFQSGLSLSEVLRCKFEVIQQEFEDGIVPICFGVIRGMTGYKHHTCIGPEAIQLLKVYFEKVGMPNPEDPIFRMCVGTRQIYNLYADREKKMLGFTPFRNVMSPNSLRKFFRHLMLNGGCHSKYIEYFCGHQVNRFYAWELDFPRPANYWRKIYEQYMPNLRFQIL